MYQLYWFENSGALAPQIVLEEIGVKYEKVSLDLDQDEQKQPSFLTINPRAQVPALVLKDGGVITESAAILLHLAEAHPEANLLPPLASQERAQVYRWLFYAATNIWDCVSRVFYTESFTTDPSQHQQIRAAAMQSMDQAWALFEDELQEGPYLLGATYSVVDAYLLMITNWHENPQVLYASLPKLARLCDAVRARPAVKGIWAQHFSN